MAARARAKADRPIKRDEAFYESVREALDEDAIIHNRVGADEPLSKKYKADPLVTRRRQARIHGRNHR